MQPDRAPCILIFPTDRRVGKIRSTADGLGRRTGRASEVYWKRVLIGIEQQLRQTGLSDEDIKVELRAFADAVFLEMGWRAHNRDFS